MDATTLTGYIIGNDTNACSDVVAGFSCVDFVVRMMLPTDNLFGKKNQKKVLIFSK